MGKKRFETITISIGKTCPISCSFCYHKNHEKGYLFNDELDKLESFMANLDAKPKEIILAGNEPLLYVPIIVRIILFIKRNYKNIRIKILTNIIALNWILKRYRSAIKSLNADLSTFQIIFSTSLAVTIDSRKELPKDWLLSDFSAPVSINIENAMFTFSASNENTSPEFIIEWAKLLHTDVIRINLDFFSKDKLQNPHSLIIKIISLIKYGIKNNVYILGDWDSILTNIIEDNEAHYCGGGSIYLTSSNILACPYIKDINYDSSLAGANNTEKILENLGTAMEKLRLEMVKRRGCNTCKLEEWCGGGCLTVDADLFCNFMRGMMEAFESDEEFRSLYLPRKKVILHG